MITVNDNYFLLVKAMYVLSIFTVSLKRLYLHLKKILYTIKTVRRMNLNKREYKWGSTVDVVVRH